jgi:HAD superfamily hydrolase (TIGR01456 family)
MARFGVALDIDGVLIRGSHLLPHARPALQMLFDSQIPTVFLTNGGGITEQQKAADLTKKIGFPISSQHLILSHTPFKQYVPRYKESSVLIIGGNECLKVANSYGFRNALTSSMLHSSFPDIYPLKSSQLSPQRILDSKQNPNPRSLDRDSLNTIEAAFVFAESCDWGLDIQILTDLLSQSQYFPIYACNADLVYNSNHPSPRYTQGAFLHAFQSLYSRYRHQDVKIEYCGKPYQIQYQYAEKVLHQIHSQNREKSQVSINRSPSLIRYYGVGDNPASDIRGSNRAGKDWQSVLVRTGIYREGDQLHKEDLPNYNEDNVFDAVKRIFHAEGYPTEGLR